MNDWIGPKFKFTGDIKKIMSTPTVPEKYITTDLFHPEGVPEFILELERDVYKENYTGIITGAN